MDNFNLLPEFEKEFKGLLKKYKTLNDDLRKFKAVLISYPTGVGKNFTVIYSTKVVKIVKARMACRALRKRSLRIIYSYFEKDGRIEFMELYFKGDKENEDRKRIKEYLKNKIL